MESIDWRSSIIIITTTSSTFEMAEKIF